MKYKILFKKRIAMIVNNMPKDQVLEMNLKKLIEIKIQHQKLHLIAELLRQVIAMVVAQNNILENTCHNLTQNKKTYQFSIKSKL